MSPRQTVKKAADALLRPFQTFAQTAAAGGILLLACAAIALAMANSPLAEDWHHFWETYLGFTFGGFELKLSLHHWINDALMAVFFFVVGLEIKRELLTGELSSARKAALPFAAALGGMVVPAAIYVAFNLGGPGMNGWAIPMATDIAFALGVLALLGDRAPLPLKVFLTALAIVDDLGAVLVIAMFYTAELSASALGVAGILLGVMVLLNLAGIRHPLPYALVGLGVWLAFLFSGIHATIAGVLAAMTIPARRKIDAGEFAERARLLVAEIEEDLAPGRAEPTEDQRDAIHSLEEASEAVETPLSRLEHGLHPWVAFFIMPVFALANAGVAFGGAEPGAGASLAHPVTLGVLLGLFVGKQIGVTLFAWLAVRLGWASLPGNATWRQVYGVSMLCGIGFTMSLFIAALAFPDAVLQDAAKIGILTGSLISGVIGSLLLATSRATPEIPPELPDVGPATRV